MEKGIFISYSHKDTQAVEQMVRIIEKTVDCKIWFDHNLKGGEQYFSVIANQILENEYFIFVVSPNSVISDFCIHELEFAMSEKRKIIAVWLEDFLPPPRVRLVISNTHYIRNYELEGTSLSQLIAQALSAEHLDMSGDDEYVVSEQKMSSTKYFVSPDEKGKIRLLLEKEKKQDFLSCFEAESAVLLGIAYELGVGVEKDITKADFYYHIASYKGSPDGEYLELSLKLDKNKRATPAIIERMNELAEGGCVRAMVYWGDEVYLGNWGMEKDIQTAYRWFKAAAEAGNPVAKYFMGFGYRVGEIEEDHAIAWMYFWEAANQHFPRAYRQIAMMYKKGQFVETNLDTARQYYHKAIESGDGLAVNFLGNLEYDEKNYEKAVAHYKEAVEYIEKMNLPAAAPFYNLGWAYEHGQGTEKDGFLAIECYLRAAERKHKSSMNRISVLINDVIKDDTVKYDMLSRAAELNCRYAEFFLARYHEQEAEQTPISVAAALRFYEQGADKGCLYCINKLMEYYSWVLGAKKYADRTKALSNYRLYFSLIDRPENKEYFEKYKDSSTLVSNFYCYAVELDIDKKDKNPDKKLALYYFRKALEGKDGMKYFAKIANIARNYANEPDDASIYYKDIAHSEEIAELCFEYVDRAFEYAQEKNEKTADIFRTLFYCYDALTYSYQKDRKKLEFLESRKNKIKSYM